MDLCLQKCDAACLAGLPDGPLPWESEDFLRPVIQDDPLLQIGTELLSFDWTVIISIDMSVSLDNICKSLFSKLLMKLSCKVLTKA